MHVVEREGFSVTHAADFVLVGSMNPEEGALRPQLLDRFAVAVDVDAPMDPRVRREAIERRLAYDADPAAFPIWWLQEQSRLSQALERARARLLNVALPGEMLDLVTERIAGHGVRSLRADLAVVRGSRALAALEHASSVTASHVEAVLPLALAHRMTSRPRDSRPGPPPPRPDAEPPQGASGAAGVAPDRVFSRVDRPTPRLVVEHQPTHTATHPGTTIEAPAGAPGAAIRARRTPDPRELDARATVMHAVSHAGANTHGVRVCADDLHERVRVWQGGTRYLFVVDSSGSHAVQDRMGLVKGAVSGLLDAAHSRHDETVVIACRGGAASVLVEPTSSLADVQRALEYLPTGGRTPLAHALELAAIYVTDACVLVLVTDGHANVARGSDDPWADALVAAEAIRCPALVIDSEGDRDPSGRPRALADAIRGTYVRLADLDTSSTLHLLRTVS